MGFQGDDRQGGGDDRWRNRDERWGGGGWDRDRDFRGEQNRGGGGWNEGRREERGWGSGSGGHQGGGQGDDRGFFQRAGEEVRSWFGGHPDEQGGGGRGHERGRDQGGGSYGWMSGGWGNQAGESWNRDRPGVRNEREGWFTDSVGGERGQRLGGSGGGAGGGSGGYSSGGYGAGPQMFEGTGYGGDYDRGRRFDRIDAGHTGTHGAHPMSAPGGGGATGGIYGAGGAGSSSRYAAYQGQQQGGGQQDPHYSEWRRRQIEDLDRDYEEYRREHQSKFESEFGGWRQKRQGQRQMLGKVSEQMEVVGSDGQHIGTVDAVRGDRIILTKSDSNAGGMHHSIPCSWVENVDERVTVNKTAEEAMTAWRSEERSRALFEREDSGSPGPHMLNRSFSGTYSDRDSDGDRKDRDD